MASSDKKYKWQDIECKIFIQHICEGSPTNPTRYIKEHKENGAKDQTDNANTA